MHFSLAGGEGAGHYVFSLSFDNFNLLGNKAAGKKISNGMVSLACLNLPIEMRYKPENLFLAGVIPGPKEPPISTSGINSYMRPIVDTFLEFWEGIYLTKTSMYDLG